VTPRALCKVVFRILTSKPKAARTRYALPNDGDLPNIPCAEFRSISSARSGANKRNRCDSYHGNRVPIRQYAEWCRESNSKYTNGKDAMSKYSFVTAFGVLIGSALLNSHAQADSIPWGYSAGNTEIFNNNNSAKTSSVKFSGASGGATGNSGIIIYSTTTTSGVGDSSPDDFSNVPFDLAFTLVDVKATGSKSGSAKSSEVLHFSGLFSASNVTNHSLLPGAAPWSSPLKAQAILGADDVGWRTYSVILSSFTSPGQPGGSPGSIQAIVIITPNNDGPRGSGESPIGSGDGPAPSATPEPASLVLAGFGILPLIAFWRTRRKEC